MTVKIEAFHKMLPEWLPMVTREMPACWRTENKRKNYQVIVLVICSSFYSMIAVFEQPHTTQKLQVFLVLSVTKRWSHRSFLLFSVPCNRLLPTETFEGIKKYPHSR